MFTKSSKCESHTCVEVNFKKSSKSRTDPYHCVEVDCRTQGNVLIRDSKIELNSVQDSWLSVSPQAWTAFLGSL